MLCFFQHLFSFWFALQQLFSPGLVAWGPLLRGSPELIPSQTEFVLIKSSQVLLTLALVNKKPLQAAAVNTQHLILGLDIHTDSFACAGEQHAGCVALPCPLPHEGLKRWQTLQNVFHIAPQACGKTSRRLLKLPEGRCREASCSCGEPESLTTATRLESY